MPEFYWWKIARSTFMWPDLILEKAGCVVEIANGTYHCHDSGCF
ncbi:MAG: hypothetical protein ACLTAX_13050 [Waltera sp.]